MDTNTLINLIETISKTLNAEGFEHIELNHEGSLVILNKKSVASMAAPVQTSYAQSAVQRPNEATNDLTAEGPKDPTSQAPKGLNAQAAAVEGKIKTIDSPIVGTFYNSAGPEAAAYVKVGDRVKKGDVVCIIEAMKLMNEIEAEFDGEIVEILIANEGPVEYGQALFKLK